MRGFVLIAVAANLWAQQPAPQDWRSIMRQSLERMNSSDRQLSSYSFHRRVIKKEFETDGKLKAQSNLLFRREQREGVWVTRLLERNGGPLQDAEKKQEEETLKRRVEEGKAAQGKAATPMGRTDTDELIQEFPEALDYTLIGEETRRGRKAWILACSPRPGYKAKNMKGRVFEKVRGKVWVDQAEKDLVRVEADVFDTILLGYGFLGRVEKGTRFVLDRARVGDKLWFTQSSQVNFSARVLLIKTVINEIISEYTDFRREGGI